jgi:hypothetical protein
MDKLHSQDSTTNKLSLHQGILRYNARVGVLVIDASYLERGI